MVVGLIDVDNWGKLKGCFPNLPLMKLSTHHKELGDTVKWYDGSYCDLVYMSKVFSFSEEPFEEINAGKVIKGGERLCNISTGRTRGLRQREALQPTLRDRTRLSRLLPLRNYRHRLRFYV